MFQTISRCLREFKKPTIFTILFMMGEAIIEAIIPFVTARLVDNITTGLAMSTLLKTGLFLVIMTLISLFFGGAAGMTSAKAAAGFAKNVRHDIFEKVQTFAFSNIDKFSSSSLGNKFLFT